MGDHTDVPNERKLRAGAETLLALPMLQEWIAGDDFPDARDADFDMQFGLRLKLAGDWMLSDLEENSAICWGLAGTEMMDEPLFRARETGAGNYALMCLWVFEELETRDIARLNVEHLHDDAFGTLLDVPARGPLGLGGSARTVRLTPFTRLALASLIESRGSGPIFADPSTGAPVGETVLNVAFIQATDPSSVTGGTLRL